MGLNKLIHLATTMVENGIAADVFVQICAGSLSLGNKLLKLLWAGLALLLSSEKPPMPALIIMGEHVGGGCG
jgi:hypothetical protein